MPPISHEFLEKLRKEVTKFDEWLAETTPQEDGTARPEDLKALHGKGFSIYQKALALHQTVDEEALDPDEFEDLRQELNKFNYWLSAKLTRPNAEDLQAIFTRANSVYLKALGLYRAAGTEADGMQEPPGDDHRSLSGS